MRGFVKLVAVNRQVPAAQIIDEDDNDIWFLWRSGLTSAGKGHKGHTSQQEGVELQSPPEMIFK